MHDLERINEKNGVEKSTHFHIKRKICKDAEEAENVFDNAPLYCICSSLFRSHLSMVEYILIERTHMTETKEERKRA